MNKLLSILAIMALVAFVAGPSAAPITPGLQVVDCVEEPPGSGIWVYSFFVCTGVFDANGLQIGLDPAEVTEGTVIRGCGIPSLPGYSCSFTSDLASWDVPEVGPFTCVPGMIDEYLEITIATADGISIVSEVWTMNSTPVGTFTTLIACSPTSTETSAWGSIKTLFR